MSLMLFIDRKEIGINYVCNKKMNTAISIQDLTMFFKVKNMQILLDLKKNQKSINL